MYRWVDHTSELELEINAASETAVLADAVAALGELLDDHAGEGGEEEVRAVAVSARDRPALLAEYLGELVFWAETEKFVPKRLASVELGHDSLGATVEGRRGHPRHLVKAVTYHRLTFERRRAGWRATVVLDV